MSRNIRSLILLFVLLGIVLFLIGFRYGKYVEYTDKSYVSPTPTTVPVTPQPTEIPFAVIMYPTKTCGVSFLIPNYLEEQIISTQEATLSKNSESIHVVCEKRMIEFEKQTRNTASPSASMIVLNQKTPVFEHGAILSIIVNNSHTKQSVLIEATHALAKLVFPSLELTK